MYVVQEDTVRQLHLRQGQTVLRVPADTYITAQAKEYIREKRLQLIVGDASVENKDIKPAKEMRGGRFVTADGTALDKKPEHMTHLHGNLLVPKTHPRIVLRGKLDSLQADIVCLQVETAAQELWELTESLEELLSFCRKIMQCEVTEKALETPLLLGMDEAEQRKLSHTPKESFGIGHLLPHHKLGFVCAGLNRLRTQAREVELAAVEAFSLPDGTLAQTDLIQALNRLSSVFYILMLRLAAGRQNGQ